MNLSRGDVVLLSFPFTDLSSQKVRPAVVLSSQAYNIRSSDIILCAVTSNIHRDDLYLIKVGSAHPDYKSSGFKLPSAVVVDKIHTLHNSLVKRKLGSVGPSTLRETEKVIREILIN